MIFFIHLGFLFNLFMGESPVFAAIVQDSIKVRLSSAPETLDWNRATSGSEGAVIQNMMEGLFRYDHHTNVVPDLVEKYSWENDGKVLRMTLKKGKKWSDGKPLTAQHCADSFKRLLDPQLNSQNASILFPLKNARNYFYGKVKSFSEVGVMVKGSREISLVLDEPRSNFIHSLTYWATFPIRIENIGLTLGTYRLVSKKPNEVHLRIREESHRAKIKDVFFKVIPNGKAALKAYQLDEVDYLLQVEDELVNAPVNEPSGTGEFKFEFTHPIKVVVLLHLNPSRVFSNTPEKRRAIFAALTQLNLIEPSSATRVKAKGIIPPGVLGSSDSQEPADLKKSGLPDSVLVLGYPQDQLSQSIAEELQRLSKDIKVRVEPLGKENAKRFDLILTIFGLDFMDPDQLLSSFLSQGTHDLFNFNSSDLPALLSQAKQSQDVKKRAQLYAQAADYLQYRAAIVAPLFYRRRAFLLRPRFTREPHALLGSPLIRDLH